MYTLWFCPQAHCQAVLAMRTAWHGSLGLNNLHPCILIPTSLSISALPFAPPPLVSWAILLPGKAPRWQQELTLLLLPPPPPFIKHWVRPRVIGPFWRRIDNLSFVELLPSWPAKWTSVKRRKWGSGQGRESSR